MGLREFELTVTVTHHTNFEAAKLSKPEDGGMAQHASVLASSSHLQLPGDAMR